MIFIEFSVDANKITIFNNIGFSLVKIYQDNDNSYAIMVLNTKYSHPEFIYDHTFLDLKRKILKEECLVKAFEFAQDLDSYTRNNKPAKPTKEQIEQKRKE
jgi:hypothetical protein